MWPGSDVGGSFSEKGVVELAVVATSVVSVLVGGWNEEGIGVGMGDVWTVVI